MTLRVISYNVRSLRDDSAAVAEVIRRTSADVALIQEAPRFLRWRSRAAALASSAGMVYVTGGRTAGAMLVMSTLEVVVVETRQVLLPKTFPLHQRGLAMAILDKQGQRFAVASFHLGLRTEERRHHAELIVSEFAAMSTAVPWVIGGDLNEEEGEPAWDTLTAGRLDVWRAAADPLGELTSSTTHPARRIDAIFCDPTFEVVTGGVPTGMDDLIARASDHRPVLAELDVLAGIARGQLAS